MDVRDVITDVVRGTSDLSTETVQFTLSDLLVASGIIGAIFFILVLLIFILKARLRKPAVDPTIQLVAGLRGKLEKLEMSLNQLKTERARAKEFYKVEFDFLRRELIQLKSSIAGDEVEAGEIPAPPPRDFETRDTEIDFKEIERVHDEVADLDEELEFEDTLSTSSAVEPAAPANGSFSEHRTGSASGAGHKATQSSGTATLDSEEPKTEFSEAVKSVRGESAALSDRLEKTRKGFFGKLKELFISKKVLDEATAEELEALLISCDLGVKTVATLMETVRTHIRAKGELEESALLNMLAAEIELILKSDVPDEAKIIADRRPDGPLVVLVVGVNGVGKTTTVAKLASRWKGEGKRVLMVAADTFRAAAVEQLKSWGEKLDIPVVAGVVEAKPATVVFDGMKRAQEENFDVLIIDTAGRLHNKSNLMQELEGVRNAIVRHQPTAPHETILVVDGATGQNALQQAKEFNDAVTLSGLIVTKLDGSPKGGIVVAIKEALGVPVRYIGVGESQEDLRPFVAADFARALFDSSGMHASGNGNGNEEVSAHAEERKRKRRETTWTI